MGRPNKLSITFKKGQEIMNEDDTRQFHILMGILKNQKIVDYIQNNSSEFKQILFNENDDDNQDCSQNQLKIDKKKDKAFQKILNNNNSFYDELYLTANDINDNQNKIQIDSFDQEQIKINDYKSSQALITILNTLQILNQNDIPFPQMLKYLEVVSELASSVAVIIKKEEEMVLEINNYLEYIRQKGNFNMKQQIQFQQSFSNEQQLKLIANALNIILKKKYHCQEQLIYLFKADIMVNLKRSRDKCYREYQELNAEIKQSIQQIINFGYDTFFKSILVSLLKECNKKKIYFLELIQFLFINKESKSVDILPEYLFLEKIISLNDMQEYQKSINFDKFKQCNLSFLLNFLYQSNLDLNFTRFSQELVEIISNALQLIEDNKNQLIQNNILIIIMQEKNTTILRRKLKKNDLKDSTHQQKYLFTKLQDLMQLLFYQYKKQLKKITLSYKFLQPKKVIDISNIYDIKVIAQINGQKLNSQQKQHCRTLFQYYIQESIEKQILFPEALYFFKCKKEYITIISDVSKIIHIMLYNQDIFKFLIKKFDLKTQIEGKQILTNFVIDSSPIFDIQLPNNIETIHQTFNKLIQTLYANKISLKDKLKDLFQKKSINTLIYWYEDYNNNNQGYLGDYILHLLQKMQIASQYHG